MPFTAAQADLSSVLIGALVPLTPPGWVHAGRHLLAGLELAVHDINAAGGIGGRPLALVGYRALAGWTATPWRSGLRRFRRALRPRSLLDDRALRRGYPVPAIPGPLGRGRRPPGQASAATCPRLLSPTRSAAHSWHGRPGRVARSRTGVERAAGAGDRRSLGSGRGLVLCAAEPDRQVLRLPLELLEHPPLDALEARTYGLRVAGAEARAIHHAPPGRCLLADVRAMFCESILTCQART